MIDGAIMSCGVSVATGLKPVPQPGWLSSTMYCVGPVRLLHVMLEFVEPIEVQSVPPFVDTLQRTIVPLYPVIVSVPVAGEGQTTPFPVKVPPLGVALIVTEADAMAEPAQIPVGATVYM